MAERSQLCIDLSVIYLFTERIYGDIVDRVQDTVLIYAEAFQ